MFSCDPSTGKCKCKPGWSSAACDRPCPLLTYGNNCAFSCPCKNGAQCSPLNGKRNRIYALCLCFLYACNEKTVSIRLLTELLYICI